MGRFVKDRKPWEVKCDVAIPCATQNELEEADARALVKNGVRDMPRHLKRMQPSSVDNDGGGGLQCKFVVEGANMPCEEAAVRQFQKNGVYFGPAKAANAGGVRHSVPLRETSDRWVGRLMDG